MADTLNFHWGHFPDDEIRLCHPGSYPFGYVKRRINRDEGFSATLLEPGFPSLGPVQSRKEGAEWLTAKFHEYYPQHTVDAPPEDWASV